MEERVLSKYPEGYFIVNHFSGGVDAEGNTLPFPPIHVHHVHNVPGAFINTYRSNIPKCVLKDKHFCPMPYRVVFEQHGDYQCTEPDGGVKCLLEDLPEGYAKYVTRKLHLYTLYTLYTIYTLYTLYILYILYTLYTIYTYLF